MEDGKDFVDALNDDIASHIFQLLSDPSDLIRAGAVSRPWRRFLIFNGLCKKLWLRKVPHVTYLAKKYDGITQLMNTASENPVDWYPLEREHKFYSSILQPLSKPITPPSFILAFPIGASSTDRDPPVTIINTVTPDHCSYWSSKGQSDPDAPEYLLYMLTTSVSIVTEVSISPLEVFSKPGRPVYSAKSVRFLLGHAKLLADADLCVCPIDRPSLEKYVWAYCSPWFPMTQESDMQEFKLPEPVVCVGGVFLVELVGRAQKDDEDGLYYIRLGHVKVMGQTLEPAFHAEMYTSGELQLSYHLPSRGPFSRCFSDQHKSEVKENEDLCPEMTRWVIDFLDDDDDNR